MENKTNMICSCSSYSRRITRLHNMWHIASDTLDSSASENPDTPYIHHLLLRYTMKIEYMSTMKKLWKNDKTVDKLH